jgi:hypothetical protein
MKNFFLGVLSPHETPPARFSGNLCYTLGLLWFSNAEFREFPVKR